MKEEQTINGLPKDWKWVKLGELCEKISNGANAKQVEEKIGLPISRIETIWNESIDLNRVKYIEEKDPAFIEKYALRKDDLLFSHINSDLHLGKTAIFKTQTNTLIHGINLLLIRFKEGVSSDFLNYQFKYKRKKGEFISLAQKSVNQSSINQTKLKNLDFILPPLEIQQLIVSKIEELFSELDKGIEELKTAQQRLKVYRQAVLKWAFEGKLTNEDVQDDELPEGWSLQNLGSIAKFINGDRGKNYPNRSEYVDIGIAFINTGHIEPNGKLSLETMHYIKREKFDTLNSGKIKQGDLVYCLRGATLGKTAIVDQFDEGAIASSLVIIRLNKDISSRFVYYFLTGPLGRDCIFQFDNGSAQPNLSAKSVTLYRIPLPGFEEQLRVVQEIESRLSVCDKIEETISDSLKQVEALRQSILKKAFEGGLIL
jgi:type I restriction enzyme S subunit